jgi:peptide/nickel transport system permease protein
MAVALPPPATAEPVTLSPRAAALYEARLPTRSSPARAVALYCFTLWAVVTVVFVLPRALPGDPLQALEDPASGTFINDPLARAKVAAYYGLDKPLLHQYWSYLVRLVHGDFGWSISQNEPVNRLIASRLPWTLLLVGSAVALSAAISFIAGIVAAWRRGKALDRTLIVSLSIARSIPEYALAALLLMCFAVFIPLFPQAGARTAFAHYPTVFDSIGDVLRHLALPLTALTLGLAASQFLLVRNTAVSALGEDYMVLARAKGLPTRLLKYRHLGRNALLPFLTAVGPQAAVAVGPALFIEFVFAYPGMASLLSTAADARDYPVLQAGFLVLALFVLTVNLIVDLTYRRLDPRVEHR